MSLATSCEMQSSCQEYSVCMDAATEAILDKDAACPDASSYLSVEATSKNQIRHVSLAVTAMKGIFAETSLLVTCLSPRIAAWLPAYVQPAL